MTKVMAFGTFDIVHPGHIFFLRQAKSLGDFFTLVVARDQTVLKLKKKAPRNNETARQKNLQALQIADKVILGSLTDPYQILKTENPDVIALGYDQTFYTDDLPKIIPKALIIRLEPFQPEIYKSSKLQD